MIRIAALWLFLGTSVVLADDARDQKARQGSPQRLDPEQIKSIQFVSRAVLGAKHSFTEDPDHTRLREQVEQLRNALTGIDPVDGRSGNLIVHTRDPRSQAIP